MNRLLLSFFGAGHIRPAPGTWGSIAAFPAAWILYSIGGPWLLLVSTPALYALGVAVLRHESDGLDDHDPSWVVVDEVVGQWIALLPVAFGAYLAEVSVLKLWPGLIAAFALFRLFDIWKPSLVGKADRRGDATGVMLDDVWAGVFAAIGVAALAAITHLGLAT